MYGHSPIVNFVTHGEVIHAVVLVWRWESSLLGAAVAVFSKCQLPAWIMTITRGVYFTVGYCLVMRKNDRGFDIQQVCGCVCTVGDVCACLGLPTRSKEAKRLCPLVEWRSHLSQHAERPTHLHRRLMTPACKRVRESMAVDVCVCVCACV